MMLAMPEELLVWTGAGRERCVVVVVVEGVGEGRKGRTSADVEGATGNRLGRTHVALRQVTKPSMGKFRRSGTLKSSRRRGQEVNGSIIADGRPSSSRSASGRAACVWV